MALHGLGKITATPGTPVRLTSNQSTPAARYPVHSFLCEAVSSNTGNVYIGGPSLNRATLADVFCVLPIPTTNLLPSFSATVSYAAAAFNLADIYLDTDVAGEGVLVSAVRA